MRQINSAGLNLVQSFEGCKLTAYHDSVGVLTIGYGHTGPDVYPGQVITQDQADQFLLQDLAVAESGVSNLVKVNITDNQFAALVDFAYNEGLGNLGKSTLLRMVNVSDFVDAANQFTRWDEAGGEVEEGLLRRRLAEQNLFNLA